MVFSFVLMIAGGIAGLGYLTYCAFFSGESIGEFALSIDRPAELELTPDMSPVAVSAGATFIVPRGQFSRRHAVYDGVLKCGGEIVWSGQFGGSIDDDEYSSQAGLSEEQQATKRYVLPLFAVPRKATYTFHAAESFEPTLEVVGLSLSARKNVLAPNITVVVIGIIAMTLGILGLVFFGIRTIRAAV